MFSDMDLIGIPHRIVLSERGIEAKQFEYKQRRGDSVQDIALKELPDFLDKLARPACDSN
jgi:prolyl-tRNA synthetase